MSGKILYAQASPAPVHLQAGPFSLLFENGAVRHLRFGKAELLSQIYAAVRDVDWGTVEGKLSEVQLEQHAEKFNVRFTSTHLTEDVHFVWQGAITGEASGKLEFEFDGEALNSFQRNRIGFCVLHPMGAAGAACVVKHTDGSVSKARFPETISPHQPFKDIRAICHEFEPGVWAQVTMTGDTFETEDQRNWTDASFKTYCTPLDKPFPVLVERGTRIRQRVRLELRGSVFPRPRLAEAPSLRLSGETRTLPKLGLGSGLKPLTARTLKYAKVLGLAHLRLDIDLQTDYEALLACKTHEAQVLGCALELALHLTDAAEVELRKLAQNLGDFATPVARYLVFHKGDTCTGAMWLRLARQLLPQAPVVGGTDAFFAELNRERPEVDALDGVTYSLNPQVHAFDDTSLIETLPVQALTVASAMRFCAAKPIVISPITLKMRHNPAAVGNRAFPLEAQRDPRQYSRFGAVWTLGSVKYLLRSEAQSLTYFELSGPLGVIADEASTGEVYPAYHVFADVAKFRGGETALCRSSHPLQFEALVLRKAGRERLLLANFGKETQMVTLHGFSGTYRGRSLDSATEQEARRKPREFRASCPLAFEGDGELTVPLNPHALVTLDAVR